MRIKFQQFLFGRNHSWSIVGQNLGRGLIKYGHQVEFVSTDGFEDKFCPPDLKPFVRENPTGSYDCQISYTAPHNWPTYTQHGTKNRFCIWNYEYNGKHILPGFSSHHKDVDLILPSSNFSKEIFLNMGIPNNKMAVIPHGIFLEDFEDKEKISLATKKKTKILLNIAQPHRRKNIPAALDAFGQAFSNSDDVCLVAKVLTSNKTNHSFDVDFIAMYKTFERKYPKHAEVEIVSKFVPNIAHIYNACDINFSATFAECWHLPSLEAIAAGIINIVPNYGGQLHFCNENNSLLINGEIKRAPRDHQYWKFNPHAVHFVIDVKDAAHKLRYAVENKESLLQKFSDNMKNTAQQFTWDAAIKQILALCN